jgi:hypothetical protein
MGWLLSLVVAFITAVAGCLGAGFLADVCVGWYRITGREGASGYFVIFMGLLGLVAGFVVGLVCARVVAAGAQPGFLKGLGLALAVAAGILAVIAALAWLGAEFPPRLEGRLLAVEVEVRLPPGRERPVAREEQIYSWHVTITADSAGRRQSLEPLRTQDAAQVDGRWILPTTVDLETTDPGKSLGVKLGGETQTQYFRMTLAGHPTRRDFEWSGWLTQATWGDLSPVPAAEACEVRYRVQFRPEPVPTPPPPSREDQEAQAARLENEAFAALDERSSFDAWLAFTHYSKPRDRRGAAAQALARRPDFVPELSRRIRSQDREQADLALRSVALLKAPPEGLAPAVEEVGREIAQQIRQVNATSAEADPSYELAGQVEVRFAGWSEAARTLHGRPGVDLRPVMKQILELARVRSESLALQDVVRVSGHYVEEWG